ncbi:MAG: glycerophosphodiester phosphodiesterase family protein [Flavobacterium sp.]
MLNIAHRGAKAYASENTLVAFQKAIDMHVDGIELDVHLCKTGELIVMHDFSVDRTTNGMGLVHELSFQEIKTLRINNPFDMRPVAELAQQIPTLTEVFELVNQKCLINIELKGAAMAKPVMDLIAFYINEKHWKYDQFLISSFDWVTLLDIHLADSKIPLGVLTESDLNLAFAFAKFINAQSIHSYYHLLTKENTAKMQEEGVQVFAWTVNEPEDIQKIKSFNVNGIISDFPDRI